MKTEYYHCPHCVELREDLERVAAERDEFKAELDEEINAFVNLCEGYEKMKAQRDELREALQILGLKQRETERERDAAQAGAESLHAAWQDAAVYWKDSRKEARDIARGLLEDCWRLLEGMPPEIRATSDSLRALVKGYPWLRE